MNKYMYSKYRRSSKSKWSAKFLNLIRKYMNYYSIRRFKNLATILVISIIIIISIFLALSVQVKEVGGLTNPSIKNTDLTNGKAGSMDNYVAPDPCTLSVIICDKETKSPVSINSKKNVNKSINQTKSNNTLLGKSLPKNEVSTTSPVKIGANSKIQAKIDYAWSISHDKDFIYTIEAENSSWDIKTIGITKDKGICQISSHYHPEIVNNPKFTDWKWQIDQCWKLYSGGVKFYGSDVRWKVVSRFKWVKNMVSN